MNRGIEPEAGKHDFSGEFCPGNKRHWYSKTFSVGIFEWVPKARGKGLKKSGVKFRIRSRVEYADLVYKKAKIVCEMMDDGIKPDGKSWTV